jgi:hypothetical protein
LAKSINIHVIHLNDGWIVQREGAIQPTSVHQTQKDAVAVARKIAREQNSQLVIHGRNGRVRERNSYSTDRTFPRVPEVLFPRKRASASKKAIKNAVIAAMRELKTNSKGLSRSSNHQ